MNDADKENQLLKSALRFVFYYNNNHAYQQDVNEQLQKNIWSSYFEGRPVITYIQSLPAFSPVFLRLYKKMKMPKNMRWRGYKPPPGLFEHFLESCYSEGKAEFDRLLTLQSGRGPRYLTAEELQHLYPNQPGRQISPELQGILDKMSQVIEGRPPLPAPTPATDKAERMHPNQKMTEEQKQRLAQVPKIQTTRYSPAIPPPPQPATDKIERIVAQPNTQTQPQNQESTSDSGPSLPSISRPKIRLPANAEAAIRRGIFRTGSTLSNAISNVGSQIVRGGLGTLEGSGAIPSAGQAAGKVAGRLGGKAAQALARKLASQAALTAARSAGVALFTTPVGWAILGIAIFLILILILPPLMKSNALLESEYTTPTFPTASEGGGSIGACTFTYQDKPVSIKSNRLKELISEVSAKTGVPAAVLAGVAVHESPDFTQNAEDNHDALSNRNFSGPDCMPHFPSSPTGALGLMQVQTPAHLKPTLSPGYNPDAYDQRGVEIGLKFLGRDIGSLATNDYCNVKTSLYLGAGVLISKNNGRPPTTADQVGKAVCGYYGSCTYGGFNYGEEVKKDFLACRVETPPSNTIPIAPTDDLCTEINKEFGVTINPCNKFTKQKLQWIWEAFWTARYRAPEFFKLLGSGVTLSVHDAVSERRGSTILFSTQSNSFFNTTNAVSFKHLLIHELGHIVRGSGQFDTELQEAVNKDKASFGTTGYLTRYGDNPCFGTTSIDEDFSETVAHYIVQSPEQDLGCGTKSSTNPLESGKYPNHLEFIQKILGKSSGRVTPAPAVPIVDVGKGAPTQCSGNIVSVGITKTFLPLPSQSTACTSSATKTCGRPGTCVTGPSKIVLHTTASPLNGQETLEYFAKGAAGRGVGAQFIIDKNGSALQLTETLDNKVEIAYAVAGYADHISIEMVSEKTYSSKQDVPTAQYQKTLELIRTLMRQYNIPKGSLEFNWQANSGSSDAPSSQITPGVYGHYQLNPVSRKDPGEGLLKDLRSEL